MISHGKRWKYAFRAFFSLIFHGRIADDILADFVTPPEPLSQPPPPPPPPVDRGDRAVQLLALLQRDGRLVDFLMEDVAPFQDAQIGAAVRDVHAGCREALARYMTLEPVVALEEGQPLTVEAGTDPARVRVVGNVAGMPPLRGVVRHRGWDATRIELPPLPGSGRTVVAPAEVEVG
jgi:hypothetical protein